MKDKFKCLLIDFNNGEGKEVVNLEDPLYRNNFLKMFDQYEEMKPVIEMRTLTLNELMKAEEDGNKLA